MSGNLIPAQQGGSMVPFEHQLVLAKAIAASGMFGMKTPEQALVLMALCESEGLHPIRAAQDYHIINGRPSMRAEAMMSRFQAAGGMIRWQENSDTRCCAIFSHPSSPAPVTIDWDWERAKKAQLLSNAMWAKYPRQMLRSRVVSEGIRTVFPGVLSGMYTPEEVRDMHDSAETSGPAVPISRSVEAPPMPAEMYDTEAAEAAINAIDDEKALKPWLIAEAKRHGWTKTHPVYTALKAVCAERAEQLQSMPKAVIEGETAEAAA